MVTGSIFGAAGAELDAFARDAPPPGAADDAPTADEEAGVATGAWVGSACCGVGVGATELDDAVLVVDAGPTEGGAGGAEPVVVTTTVSGSEFPHGRTPHPPSGRTHPTATRSSGDRTRCCICSV